MRFQHLEDVGLGYVEHGKAALGLAGCCLRAAAILCMHAVYPDFGGTTGTQILTQALEQLKKKDE